MSYCMCVATDVPLWLAPVANFQFGMLFMFVRVARNGHFHAKFSTSSVVAGSFIFISLQSISWRRLGADEQKKNSHF